MAASAALIKKINALSDEHGTQVEDFVDFLRQRSDPLAAGSAIDTTSFALVWENPDDDVYNAL
jgi:hypothetical protein